MVDNAIWYRGEALNIAPAKAGEWTHDFADGVYFASTQGGAKPFAERAAKTEDQRLYQVRIDLGSIRVLKLSSDPRWNAHMNEKTLHPGGSRLAYLKMMPSATHYNDFFTEFTTKNKINLSDYDAVQGPLLQHGGEQLCILHKNGQPSKIATDLRSRWTPATGAITPATPPGALKFNGKLGRGIKGLGGTIIGLAVAILISWLFGKTIDKLNRDDIEKQMKSFEPEIRDRIAKNKSKVLFILAEQRRAFVEIRFAVVVYSNRDAPGPGDQGWIDGFPSVELADLEITDRELPKDGVSDGSEDKQIGTASRKVTDYFKMTVELTADSEEVRLFRAYLDEINWYDEQLAVAPSNKDMQRLKQDRDALQSRLEAALAD